VTLPHKKKVDYATDEQWKMWVKVGVRKLVSMDGVTVSMTEHERNIVTQNYSSTVTSPSTGAGHHETVAVYRN
jgi:hypothetical protein